MADGNYILNLPILDPMPPVVIDGGGGGSGDVQIYTGASPPAAPDDPTLPAVYYPTSGGTLSQWDTVGLAWV